MQRTPPEMTANARHLRNGATNEERQLWAALRTHRPRFTRQLVVDRFILDFACRSLRLAIELDGGHHACRLAEDAARTADLTARGWRVMRFWNKDVRDNLAGVVETIIAEVARASTHPLPLPEREGRTRPKPSER